MLSFLISLLVLLLYAILCVIAIEIICAILGLFFAIPPKIKQLLYAFVGVCFLIYVIEMMATGTPIRLPRI